MIRPLTGYGHEVNIVVERDLCGFRTGGLYGRGRERDWGGCGMVSTIWIPATKQ